MEYTPNTPQDGEIAESCMWNDDRPVNNAQDAMDSLHVLHCDEFGCEVDWLGQITSPTPIDLTYNAAEGLWLCPTHYAEVLREQEAANV